MQSKTFDDAQNILISQRLQAIIDHYGTNARRLSKRISISPSTMSELLAGNRNPSFAVVAALVSEFPNISARWLLTGVGEMFDSQNIEPIGNSEGMLRSQHDTEAEARNLRSQVLIWRERAEAAERNLAELKARLRAEQTAQSGLLGYQRELETECVEEWALGAVVATAQLAHQDTAHHILNILAAQHPNPVGLDLLETLDVRQEELMAVLTLLVSAQLVEEGPGGVRLTQQFGELRADGSARHQQTLEAARILFTQLLPKKGRLVLADLWVPSGTGRAVADRIASALHAVMTDEAAKSGKERVSVVAGLTVDNPA